MDQQTIFLTFLGMMLVTYIPRLVPMLALSSRELPESVARWLSFVPTAVLSAMLLPSLLLDAGQVNLGFDNLFLWAAVPAFILAFWKRGFFMPVVVGMGLVILGRSLGM